MRNWLITTFLCISLFAAGCKAPQVPPEVQEAEVQEHNLWRAGGAEYAPEDYQKYSESYREAKNKLIKERAKFIWFRKYEPVEIAFKNLLDSGEKILEKIQKEKEIKSNRITSQLTGFKSRIDSIKDLCLMVSDGTDARFNLMHAEVLMREVDLLHQKGDLEAAEKKLEEISFSIKDAEDLVLSGLGRYIDRKITGTWKKWVEETLSESRKKGIVVIIVSKFERKLSVYKKGKPLGTYDIGLARNGLADKLHAGDYATPEGKYRIIKKLPSSRYYKALMINYPNREDEKKFNLAKKKGLVPSGISIGSLIEIHGGGNDSLTDGCISLENDDIDKIFNLVEVGTPVTIVGAIGNLNKISLMIKGL